MSNSNGRYILKGKEAVPCEDLMEWAKWFQTADRKVAKDTIDGVDISTCFLGLDHPHAEGAPQLFETMVFNGTHDGHQRRCATWEQAEMQHGRVVQMVKDALHVDDAL